MSPLKTWLRKLFSAQYAGRRRSLPKKKRQAPVLERLEDRVTPSASTIAFIPHDATIVTAGQVSGLITFKVTDGSGNAVAGEKVDLSSTSPSTVFFAGSASTTPITSVVTGASGTGSFVFEDPTAGAPALAIFDAANTLLSATQVETVNTVAASATFGEFPGDGVWRYEAATGWQQTTPVNASILVKDGAGDAFAEFPGAGIWELQAGSGSYRQLTSVDASVLAADARGDLVAELPGNGVYELAVNGGWQPLTTANATALSINDQGQITGLFAGAGGGVYQMNAGGGWQQISPVTGSAVAAAANVTVVEFPGYGVQEFTASGWKPLSPVNASVLGVDANGDVFGEFPGYGVLELKAGTTNWKQTTPTDASTFEVDGQGNVVADFPQYGTYILSPGAGWTQITGADSTALGGLPVAASVPNTITFIAPDAATLTSGADSGAITVQVLDQFGNPLAGEQVDLSTSNTATGAFFANAGSTTKITDVVTGANGTASFVYTDTSGAGADLTAHADGNTLVTTTQFETVNAAAAKTISFTSSAQALTAGVDSATVSVKVVDKNGNPLVGEQVNLSSTDAATGTFFASASSTTPITSVLTGANGVATFVYEDTLKGTPTLTATDALVGSVTMTQTETVNANGAAKLAITSVAQTITAGVKSSTITVQVEDQYGNVVAKSGDTVNLTSSSAKGLFFNAGGTLTITSVATGAAGSATFLYEDTTAGAPTIKATDATTTTLTPATQQETINASTAFQLAFSSSSPPQELTAGEVSNAMVVQVEDQFGNAVNENNDNVNLSTSSNSTGKFVATASSTTAITTVTTGAGGSATFYYIDTLSGTPTLSTKDTTNAALTSPTASQQETVSPNVAYKLEFTTTAQIFTAGVTGGSPLTVQVVDQYGNVVTESGDTVNLTSTSTGAHGGVFYASAGSSTPITSVMTGPSGSVSFYYEDSTLGHPTITAADSNTRLVGPAATQVETVAATAPYQIGFTTSAESQTAGTRSAAITIQVEDQFGNATAENGDTINLTTTSGTGKFFLAASGGSAVTSVTTNAGGTATFYYSDTTVGTPMLTATDTNVGLTIKTVHQTETVTQAGASTITFTTTAETQTAGTKSANITVLVKDQFGNVLNNEVVNLSSNSTSGTDVFYNSSGSTVITSVTTGAAGTASFEYYDTLAGTPTITATDNVNSAVTQTQTETVNPNVAYKLVFTTPPQTLAAGQKSTPMTVEVEDQYGNEVNVTDTIDLTSTSGNGIFYDSATGMTQITSVTTAGGQASFIYQDTTTGFPSIHATDTTEVLTFNPASQSETIGTSGAYQLVFITTAQTITAGNRTTTITVQVEDQFGNDVDESGDTVDLSTTSGSGLFYANATGVVAITSVTTGATGSASFVYYDQLAGSPILTAKDTNSGLHTQSATQVDTVNAAAASQLIFISGTQSFTHGTTSGTITIQAKDQFGNPVSGTVVSLGSSSGTGSFFNLSDVQITSITTSGANGEANFTYSDSTPGSPTVTITDENDTGVTAMQTETVT